MKTTKSTGSARSAREQENLEIMVRLYCHREHHGHELCLECRQLLDYASAHMEQCRFGAAKPICDNCSFGCYVPVHREKLKAVIAATRPRMLWQHPNLSLRHWFDHFHQAPQGNVHDNYGSWGME
jgi:hypothetical protein